MSRWLQQSFIYSGYIVKTHFKLLGMINLFSSVNVIFLFILFFSPGALQPVSRWNLSFPSLWSYPGGWPRAVWLCTGPHWCQTSCSQDPGDSKQDVKNFLVQYNHKCCHLTVFYFQTPEGSKWFSVWRVPLSDCSGNAPSGHWSFSSQAHDWSAVVLHQEQW